MPRPRLSNLSRQTRNAKRIRNTRNKRTEEEQEIAREQCRVSMARLRASQSEEQIEAARETARLTMRNRRANNRRQQIDNLRRRTRDLLSADLNRAAFRYDFSNDYSLHPSICIGQMDVVCKYCGALKFSGETPGLCCLSGKVKLPLWTPPPEPLYSLLCGETQMSDGVVCEERNFSDCDPVYDTPLEARLRKQLTRKTALYVKHSKHNILLRQKVIRLKRKCASLKQVLLSNPQKKKRSQEELELIEQFNKDSTDEDISGDGSSDEEISNGTRTGASKSTHAKMASTDDSDYEGELYDFGNFVTEQLLSLNVEESRVTQMKIKNLLAEFRKTETVDSYSEPSTSKTRPTQAKKRKIQIQSRPNMTMQSKAKQNKNKAGTEPASELQTHSLSVSDTPLQFEVQQMRNDTAIAPAGYVVTPTLTDGVNWVKNEGFTVLLAGFDTSPEVFMAQSEPAQAVSYGTPVDQISVKMEPGATSTESLLYADTIVKVEPSETEGFLQAAEKESVFKIEPEEPEEEEV